MPDLFPAPTVDSACLHCNERPPVEGLYYCAECLQRARVEQAQTSVLLDQYQHLLQNQPALGAESVPRVQAWTARMQEHTARMQEHDARLQEWNARVTHNEARRAGQRDMLAAWRAQRAAVPLPEPPEGATKEMWFAYVSDQRERGTRESWQAIAARSGYAQSTLKAGYSKWQKAKTTKNNLVADD